MNAHALSHVFIDHLQMCNCGRPESAAVLVKQILELMPLYDNRQKFEALIPNEGAQHLILGVLTKAHLIEHGGGIGGSWMRDEGKEVLESLQEIGKSDPEFDSIFSNETAWEGCPICEVR